MPHWLIKSAIHRAISLMPGTHFWNGILQATLSRSLELNPERFEHRLALCRRHLEHLREFYPQATQSFSVFELGTGWHAVVPAGLFLCGASEIWTVDIVSHLDAGRLEQALGLICEYSDRGALARHLPGVRPERLARLKQAAAGAGARPAPETLEALGIHARVRDAQDTGLPTGSIDLVISDAVLEYLPQEVLANMLREFKRIARPGAVLSHYLNLGDQYATFDHQITPFNFLKYSQRQWRWLDSPVAGKSRRRLPDYRRIFAEAGCPVLREDHASGGASDLAKIRLAPEFRHYSQEDLLVIQAWIAARYSSAPAQRRDDASQETPGQAQPGNRK